MPRVLLSLGTALILPLVTVLSSGAHAAGVTLGSPSIRVISPLRQVTVGVNGKISIQVQVSGMKLSTADMGRKAIPGEGHYHYYVDCIPSAAYSQPNNFGGCWAGAVATERAVFDLATSHVKVTGGTHVLFLALAQNDHVLYPVPPASVIFRVATTPVSIQLLSPKSPVTVRPNGKVPVSVKVTGLKLNPQAMGRKNVDGQGHLHFYVDCVPADGYTKANLSTCWAAATASPHPTFDLSTSRVKVTSGTHLLFVALARNDHVLYRTPPVSIVFSVSRS